MGTQQSDILFFCSFPPPNTGQTIATKLIHDALAKQYSIDVINIADKNRFERKSGGFSFSVVLNLFKKLAELRKSLRKKKYSIVYVVYAPYTFSLLRDVAYTWIIKRTGNAKLIAHLHCGNYGDNFKNGYKRKLFEYLLKQTDTLIFLSPMLKHFDYPENKTAFLTNMISEDVVCTEEDVAEKFNSKQGQEHFSIYFISNMIAEKGYEDLVEAAKILSRKKKLSFSVHLVGGWPSVAIKTAFIKRIRAEGLGEIIKVYGPVTNRATIKSMFLEADVFVLPTYYPVEAQPLSIIEAFNAATPVIATKHASIPDMVKNDENGFLIDKKNPQAIADKILSLLDRKKWHEMALKSRQTYLETYQKNIIAPKLKSIFRSDNL